MSQRFFAEPPSEDQAQAADTSKKDSTCCPCLHSIRVKTLITLVISFCIMLICLMSILLGVFPASFAKMEDTFIRDANHRVLRTMYEDIFSIARFTLSYSGWDLTYDLPNQSSADVMQYMADQFSVSYMTQQSINFVLLYDLTGKLIGTTTFDSDKKTMNSIAVPSDLFQVNPATHPFFKNITLTTTRNGGIITFGNYTGYFGGTPVLKSDYSGPSNGFLLFGRFISPTYVSDVAYRNELCSGIWSMNDAAIQRIKALATSVNPVKPTAVTPNWENNYAFLTEPYNSGTVVQGRQCSNGAENSITEQRFAAYSVLADIYGKPTLIVSSDTSRDLLSLGVGSNVGSAIGFAVICVFATIIIMLFVEFIVLRPTINLSKKVKEIGDKGDLSVRVSYRSNDELGIMSGEVDKMISSLENSQNKIKAKREQLQVAVQRIAVEEQKAKAVMDAIPDIIVTFTRAGNVVQENQSFFKILKYQQAKSENLQISKIIPQFTIEQYDTMVKEGSKPVDVELSTVFGEKIQFQLVVFAVKFMLDDKEQEGFVILGHSLAEQQKLMNTLQSEKARMAQLQNVMEFEGYMRTPVIRNAYREFCKQNHNDENILFIDAVEQYKALPKTHERIAKQQEIIKTFLAPDAPKLLNLASATAENEVFLIKQGVGHITLFDKLLSLIKIDMVNDSFQRFYKEYLTDANAASRLSTAYNK